MLFLLSLFFFIALLVVVVPIGKDYYARRKSPSFARFLALFDLQIDIVGVRNSLFVVAQKFVCLNRIVLDDGVKFVEELSIRFHLRALYVGLRPANHLLFVSGLFFHALKAMNDVTELFV